MKDKSTAAVIGALDGQVKSLNQIAEYWGPGTVRNFPEHYHAAMLRAGISKSRADEVMAVIRHYLDQISGGVEQARYAMNQMIGEMDDIRRRAQGRTRLDDGTGFRV